MKPNMPLDEFDGIPCQALADAIRECRGTVMDERLAEAAREATRKGLLTLSEASQLEREFPS
jgi:hypothetical protein